MTILYLGLKVPDHLQQADVIHYPIIRIIPKDPDSPDIQKALADFAHYTHCLFTSQSAVSILCQYVKTAVSEKTCLAVGRATAKILGSHGAKTILTAQEETAEGVIHILEEMDLRNAFLFWPHSAKSRKVLPDYLKENRIRYSACVLYDTVAHKPGPLPDLSKINEIVFTSPTTVDAFVSLIGRPPQHIKLTSIGPVTKTYTSQTFCDTGDLTLL